MADFYINVNQVKNAIKELDEIIKTLNVHSESLRAIRNGLSSTVPQLQKTVDSIIKEISRERQVVCTLKEVGEQIVIEVQKTEYRIISGDRINKEIKKFLEGVAEYIDDLILTKEEREKIEQEIEKIISENADVTQMSDEEKEHLIDLYEQLYPEQGRNIDSVLEPMVDEGYDDHVQNIKVLAYTAEEPYRSLFLDNVGDVNIIDLDCNTTQNYNHGKGGISLDIDKWEENPPLDSGTYATFFHECSHAIDYQFGEDGTPYTQMYKDSDGNTLNDILENNVREDIANSAEEYLDSVGYSEEEKAAIKSEVEDAILNCADIKQPGGKPTFSSDDVEDCYDAVVSDLKGNVSGSSSDIYGGLTGNTLRNGSGHTAVRTNEEGEKWSYWTYGTYDSETNSFVPNTDEDGSLSYKPSIGKEFFAEYMAAYMTGDVDEMKGIEAYSDDTEDYIKDLINTMD